MSRFNDRFSVAERQIEADVADWILDVIQNKMNGWEIYTKIRNEFINADGMNFSIIVEKREEIDGIRWYDVYRTAWYLINGREEWYDMEVMFSLRESADIFDIEKELLAWDFDYFND